MIIITLQRWLFICLVTLWNPVSSQKIVFDAFRDGDKVGALKVNRECEGSICQYHLNNKVTIKMLITVDVELDFQCMFKDGKLKRADTKQLRNGNVKENSYLSWEENKYLYAMGKDTTELNLPQTSYSTNLMYFEEPVNRTEVFSERFGKLLGLREIDPHTYELSLPDNSKNVFYYKDGRCERILIKHFLGNVNLVRVNAG